MNEIETIYDEVSGFADGKNSLVSGNGGYRILKNSMDPQNNDLVRSLRIKDSFLDIQSVVWIPLSLFFLSSVSFHFSAFHKN